VETFASVSPPIPPDRTGRAGRSVDTV